MFRLQELFVHSEDGIERRADFVAHGGQEHVLGLIGCFSLFFGMTQIILHLPTFRYVPGNDDDAGHLTLGIM